MATPEALDSLRQTITALREIQTQLRPFIPLLNQDNNAEDRARAQAAVALAIGTLRYMGARLRGLDQGRKPDDPLRQELNQMRKVLVAVQDVQKKKNKESPTKTARFETKEQTSTKESRKEQDDSLQKGSEPTSPRGETKTTETKKRRSPEGSEKKHKKLRVQ